MDKNSGPFSRILSAIGIQTGPSKLEQQRAYALQKQQEAMRIAHEDHRARVQALNVSRGALQDGGQFTVAPEQFYNATMLSPSEQDERAARMAEARKMTDEESNGSIAYATPVSHQKSLSYVNADFESDAFTEMDNKWSYDSLTDLFKTNFQGMSYEAEKRGNLQQTLESFGNNNGNVDENMQCVCSNGECSCTLVASHSHHKQIPLNGGTLTSSIDARQTISGLNIDKNKLVEDKDEEESSKNSVKKEEFISIGNNEIKTNTLLQILICLGIIYIIWVMFLK